MKPTALELLKAGAMELGLQLSSDQVEQFNRYGEELKKWNKKINLTAIRTDEEIVIKHFIDSLTPAKFLESGSALLDIGSGAGFPCLPLKILMPNLPVTSIDAVEKKIFFQRSVSRALGLQDFQALHGRAEQLQPENGRGYDVIVSRAFSDIPTFAQMARPLLKNQGKIIAMKGKEGRGEAIAAADILDQMGMVVTVVEEFTLPFSQDARSFVFIGAQNS